MDFGAMMAKVRQRVEENASGNDRPKPTSIPDGNSSIRILPPWTGQPTDPFFRFFGTHFVKSGIEFDDAGSPKLKAIALCEDIADDKPCEVCNAINQALPYAANNDEVLKALESSRSRRRVLVNALIRSGAGASAQPVVLEMPHSLFDDITKIMMMYWEQAQINCYDPNTGVDFLVSRTGTRRNTRYTVNANPGVSAPVPADVLTQLHDLNAFVDAYRSPAENKRALTAVAASVGLMSATDSIPAIAAPNAPALTAPISDAMPTPLPGVTPLVNPTPPPVVNPTPTPVVNPTPPPVVQTTPAMATPAAPIPAQATVAPSVAPQSNALDAEIDDLLEGLD